MQEETIVIEPTPEKQTIPQEKKKGKGCFGCLLGCFAIVVVVVLLGLAAIWSLNGKLTVFTGNLQKIDREDLEEEFEEFLFLNDVVLQRTHADRIGRSLRVVKNLLREGIEIFVSNARSISGLGT